MGCVLTIFSVQICQCTYTDIIHIVKICSIDVISSVRYVLKSPDLFHSHANSRRAGKCSRGTRRRDACTCTETPPHTSTWEGAGLSMHFIVRPGGAPWLHGSARPLPLEPPCNRVLVFLLLTTFGAIYAETWERSASPPRLPV